MRSEYEDVMLDLETLGTKPGSVVLSAGAVEFSAELGLGRRFYRVISIEDSMRAGLTTDNNTIQWWEKQSDEARLVLADARDIEVAMPLIDFCHDFANWLPGDSPHERYLWGNGANFDNVLLDAVYDAAGFARPVTYNRNMCYRTLRRLVPLETYAQPDTAHHALSDAVAQATNAVEILRKIRGYERSLATAREVCTKDAQRLVKLHDDNVELRELLAKTKIEGGSSTVCRVAQPCAKHLGAAIPMSVLALAATPYCPLCENEARG
jgi:hypothetical protein